jgi:peptidoglycan/LPS O-acetylase OafA/YrhL
MTARHDNLDRYVWLSQLRAFGVILVLIYHFFPAVLPGGFIGVDVFFVFSGFLITSLLLREYQRNGSIALLSFYRRRLRRLLPAILVTLLLVLPLTLLISPDFRAGIIKQVAAMLGWVTNFYEIANGQSYANQLLPHLFVHTWTLSIEMQFYLLWGLLLSRLLPVLAKRAAQDVENDGPSQAQAAGGSQVGDGQAAGGSQGGDGQAAGGLQVGDGQAAQLQASQPPPGHCEPPRREPSQLPPGHCEPPQAARQSILKPPIQIAGQARTDTDGGPSQAARTAGGRAMRGLRFASIQKLLVSIAFFAALLSFGLMQLFLVGAEDPSGAYFNTLSHFFPLMLGSATGVLAGFTRTKLTARVARMGWQAAVVIVILCLTAIAAMSWLLSFENLLTYRFGLLLTSVLVAVVLVIGRAFQLRLRHWREVRVLTWLADRSYGLYLFHWPLFIIANNFGKPGSLMLLPDFQLLTSTVFPIIALILTFVCAGLSYRFIETPFAAWAARRSAAADAPVENRTLSRHSYRLASVGTAASRRGSRPLLKPALAVRAGLALVLALGSSFALATAPAYSSVTQQYEQQSMNLDIVQLQSLNQSLGHLEPNPVVGLGAGSGLPPKPSDGGGADTSVPLDTARGNMAARLQQGGGGASGSVTVIGDSVCLGAAEEVAEVTGGYVDADGFRTMGDALPIIQSLQDSGSLGEYLVIALATNRFSDCKENAQLIVDMLEPGHHLIFVTSHGVDDSFYGLGDFIRDLPERYDFVSIADWHAVARNHRELLSADGIHCGMPEARMLYARSIEDAINAAEGRPRK